MYTYIYIYTHGIYGLIYKYNKCIYIYIWDIPPTELYDKQCG